MVRSSGVAACFVLALACATSAAGNGVGSHNYRSELRSIEPRVAGLQVRVLGGDDSLMLENRTGETVAIPGYQGEPYVRIHGNGRVEINLRSPSKYLNEDRYAQVDVPRTASAKAPPQWQPAGSTGSFRWHEHRIHWMSHTLPPQVVGEDEETKVYDWTVPLEVGPRRVALKGTLWWDPPGESGSSGIPTLALVAAAAGGVLVLGAVAFWLRGRRRPSGGPAGDAW